MKAFTLIEVLLVSVIAALIAVGGFISLAGYIARQDLDLSAKAIVATLRDAQSRSVTSESSSAWGVRFSNTARNYILATVASDGTFGPLSALTALKPSLTFLDPAAGTKDIVFSTVTGEPNPRADVIVKVGLLANPAAFRTITVYKNGRIEEQ